MFSLFKKKPEDFFAPYEKQKIVAAIKQAELSTSGEVRVFIESKCRFVNAIDRAKELFEQLDMFKTKDRNAVIVYLALKHRQLAIYADIGIHEKMPKNYWEHELQSMIIHFKKDDYATGIANVVTHIGESLKHHFPHQRNDTNELSDEVVFGK